MKGTFGETETQKGLAKGVQREEANFGLVLKTNRKQKSLFDLGMEGLPMRGSELPVHGGILEEIGTTKWGCTKR